MDLGMAGKVAMVTGASRGLGRFMALRLAEEGCDLAICARSAETLAGTANEIRALDRRVLARPLDVTAVGAAEEMVDAARKAADAKTSFLIISLPLFLWCRLKMKSALCEVGGQTPGNQAWPGSGDGHASRYFQNPITKK